MKENINMTSGNPTKLLVWFALPLMFGNIFQQMYIVVDTVIVGRGVGMTALAAMGSVDWITWMMLSIAQGFTQGCSVRIAQKYGEGDAGGLRRYMGQSARLTVIAGVVITIAAMLLLPAFIWILRVPEELQGIGMLYIRIIIAGFPLTIFYNYCAAVLRAVGDSKTPLKAMIVASLTNVVLDCIAVFVLDWGIAGAGAATVIAQGLAGIICLRKVIRMKELHFNKEHIAADAELSKDLIWLGIPVAMKNLIISIGGIALQSIVNGFSMGFIAGFTATNKLYGILEIAAISYGYAITTYIGQNFGAGDFERIKKGIRSALKLALGTSVVIGAIMILFGRSITGIFLSSDIQEQIIIAGNTAYYYLVVMSVGLPALYILCLYLAALQGLGNTMDPMISGIIELVMRVSVAIVIAKIGYAYGIFAGEILAWIGAAVYLVVQYYRTFRKEEAKYLLKKGA